MTGPTVTVLALVASAAALPLGADTYVVDRNHPAASDANPGTASLPWLTIQHAADTLVAGDTVWVRAGTYPEQVTVTSAGAPGQEIVFAAWPGDTVTVDGSGLTLNEWDGLFQVVGGSYIRVSGFHVTGTGPWGTNTGIQVDPGDHVVIEGNHTSYTASSGILVFNATDIVIAGNEVEQAMTMGVDSRNECITVGRTAGFEVKNNHVHSNPNGRGEGICLKDGSTAGSAHHNHVHDVPSVGIYVDAWTEPTHDIEVAANVVHDVDGSGIQVASEQGGLLERVRLVNNVSHHNRYTGLAISDCCTDTHPMDDIQIVNNSFWGNGWADWGGGLGVGNPQATAVLIRNNAMAGNLSFEITFEGVGTANSTVDHNLVGALHGYPDEECGTDCVVGDPLWVDPAAGDLHLQPGSPAVDHGSPDLAPADDLDGTARPQGPGFDIGACELADAASVFADGFESGGTSAWSATAP